MYKPIKIHFFRNTSQGRINNLELFNYFTELPNFEIKNDANEDVSVVYSDHVFGFAYEYKMTKVSQITAMYKIQPEYISTKFMLCLPLLIPEFAVREILTSAQTIAKKFEFSIYHEDFESGVKPFNIADILSLFYDKRREFLEENPNPINKVFVDHERLSVICKYQRILDNLYESFHQEIEVRHSVPIIDHKNDEFGICTYYNLGVATLFAPYFDFVNIKDEDGESFYIRREHFMKFMDKYLTKIENNLPDTYILKKKQAKSSKSVYKKLKNYAVQNQVFEVLKIADLIDKA